jgi:hypothetical protein
MSYGVEDWSDAGHHDYQYELERVVEAISSTMLERFADWIRKLPIPAADSFSGKLLPLDPGARYLNFNYTPTLQRTYGIADGQVLHIHGQAGSPTDQLVLGHGWRRTPTDSLNYGVVGEDADTRVLEGNRIVDDYFSATFKPTDKIIHQQQPFFHSLKNGAPNSRDGTFSSDVDAPYFEEIIKNIDPSVVRWKISYHGTPASALASMSELGIDPTLSTFARLSEF